MIEDMRPDRLGARSLRHECDGQMYNGFQIAARSKAEGKAGLGTFDVVFLGLTFFVSGAIMGIVFQGNVLLAIGIYGTIIVGGLVGWYLHVLFAGRAPRSDLSGMTGSMEGLSHLYSVEWHSLISRDAGWTTIEASSIEEARNMFQKDHGDTKAIRGISLITSERGHALPWR